MQEARVECIGLNDFKVSVVLKPQWANAAKTQFTGRSDLCGDPQRVMSCRGEPRRDCVHLWPLECARVAEECRWVWGHGVNPKLNILTAELPRVYGCILSPHQWALCCLVYKSKAENCFQRSSQGNNVLCSTVCETPAESDGGVFVDWGRTRHDVCAAQRTASLWRVSFRFDLFLPCHSQG